MAAAILLKQTVQLLVQSKCLLPFPPWVLNRYRHWQKSSLNTFSHQLTPCSPAITDIFVIHFFLLNGSHIYAHSSISSVSWRPPGKPTSSLHRFQRERLFFTAHMSPAGVSHNCTSEMCIDLPSLFPEVKLSHSQVWLHSHWVSALLYLFTRSVFQKVVSTLYCCESVMQIVFSVYLIWCWQE